MFPVKKTSARIDSRDIVKERSLERKQNRLAEYIYPKVEENGREGSLQKSESRRQRQSCRRKNRVNVKNNKTKCAADKARKAGFKVRIKVNL